MATRWRGLIGLSCVALAACQGPAASEPPQFKEGTRLKAIYQEVEGAPPFFLSWYDTELGVDCLFGDVGFPDRQVCFPTNRPNGIGSSIDLAGDAGVFSDSGCTQSLFRKPFGVERFAIRLSRQGLTCEAEPHLFSVGTEPVSEQFQLDPLDPSTCVPARVASFEPLYPLGPEIPLDTLVSGTFRPGQGSGRIVPLEIAGSDGSVQLSGSIGRVEAALQVEVYPGVFPRSVAWDKERSEAVSESFQHPTNARWLPNYWDLFLQAHQLFADAACSVPVIAGPACLLPLRAILGWEAPDACGRSGVTVAGLGAPVPNVGQLYYVDPASDACAPHPGSPGADGTLEAFAPGEPIPLDAFAAVTKVHAGSKQVQLIQAATADGPAAYPLGFWDRTHGQTCVVSPAAVAADDVFRCLPDFASTLDLNNNKSAFFADPACSAQLVSLSNLAGVCPLAPTIASSIENLPDTDILGPFSRAHFFPIGDRHLGSVYYNGDGTCSEIAAPEGQELHTVGPEVPATDFAAVKTVRPD